MGFRKFPCRTTLVVKKIMLKALIFLVLLLKLTPAPPVDEPNISDTARSVSVEGTLMSGWKLQNGF